MADHSCDRPSGGALQSFVETTFPQWCEAMQRTGFGDAVELQRPFWSMMTFQVAGALHKRLAQPDSQPPLAIADDLIQSLAFRLVSECMSNGVSLLHLQAAIGRLRETVVQQWESAEMLQPATQRAMDLFFEGLSLAAIKEWQEQRDKNHQDHEAQQTRMLKYLSDLRLLTWAVGSGLPLPAILEKIVQKISDYELWQRCLVGIWEAGDKKLPVVPSSLLANEVSDEEALGHFVWQYVLQERRVILIPDIRHEPYPPQLGPFDPGPYRSLIIFPLFVEDRILGVLALFHPEPNLFASRAIDPLTPFAQLAAITINIAQSQHLLLLQKRELEFLYRLGRLLDRSLETQVMVQNLAQAVSRGLRYRRCVIDLWDEDSSQLLRGADDGLGTLEDLCRQSAEAALDSGTVVWHRDVTAVVPDADQNLPVRGYVCVPIVLGAMRLGAMHLYTGDVHDFSGHEIELLITVSSQAASALHHARFYQQAQQDNRALHQVAVTDTVTELYNRAYLNDCLQREVARSHRYHQPFTIAILDIDGFKGINDTFGHPVGDKVLRHLAGLMCQQFRRPDILARMGGDEFVVLLPECLLADAERACDRFRKKVAASRMLLPAGQEINVTISIGLAQLYPGQKPELLVEHADRALLRAKAEGKDRVRSFHPGEILPTL